MSPVCPADLHVKKTKAKMPKHQPTHQNYNNRRAKRVKVNQAANDNKYTDTHCPNEMK